MKSFLTGLFDSNDKQLKKIQPIIDQINDLEDEYRDLKDSELKEKTLQFKETLGSTENTTRILDEFDASRQKRDLFQLLPEAFALVRESARRYTNHRHFDVQLQAGYFLADNKITELFTGEGKTNAATLALYLYALTGRGAHLVTVNDYLARRDGEWNGHVLAPLGITVGVINNNSQYKYVSDEEVIALKGAEAKDEIDERKAAAKKAGRLKLDLMSGTNLVECSKKEVYECDVVYGTNNEFGFDYLRDNMARRIEDRVQGRLHYAIIDEADSILIDEARTPLIISQSAEDSNDMYSKFAQVVRSLNPEEHYTVDEKEQSVSISDNGIDLVEKKLGVKNVYEDAELAYHLDNALKAKELYSLDDQYIVRNGEIIIVDEFTGRAMEGRRYSEGLHQAIEAKEGVEVKQESKTLATITLQNYFRLYDYLAGMTATALTEAEEFSNIYKLDVVVVPTNKPVIRTDENDVVYRSETGKFRAIIEDIKDSNDKGQPVLVGTASVEKSEVLSQMLEREGIKHNVLNAKQHEREAHIIQDAGLKGQVTIATNMAGRGTDIALGEGVVEQGGLYVIGSERHESRRIDNQLRGRSGRQGDPGRSRFYVSFEDDLMKRFGGDRSQAILERVGMEDDMPISIGVLGKIIENAQKKVEAYNFDIRKRLVEYDDVLNQQREIIYGLRRDILQIISENSDVSSEEGLLDVSEKELKKIDPIV
ncbi:preprotein translocase subunit SecA, partial [Candidatus Dojkabacteria bacterium]|nr:preprotein translocase subunit SecA [Candidatus Dojkabacteria bacterium]